MELSRPARPALTYGTYPVLALLNLAAMVITVQQHLDQKMIVAAVTVATIIIAFTVERLYPLRDEWRMTKDSFFGRDLPFIGLAFVVEQLAQTGVALVAARSVRSGGFGPLARTPLAVQVIVALILFDLLWYAYHRAAHTFSRLWRFHSVHHSPSQVYVFVHQVFHPLDLVISSFAVSLVVFQYTGITPAAAFAVIVIRSLQQTVSHMNSDLRTGWLNYLLIGTETHRFHHSAEDRGNYGSAVALWDLLFGTFVYHPSWVPNRLGLDVPADYPDPRRFHATLAWPLLGRR
jgi:sterol desaturase/sphingolipid hydroxylase (fatty acid hydroxylase superfamily)